MNITSTLLLITLITASAFGVIFIKYQNRVLNIEISIGTGNKTFKAYTCDLTHDYISINADYRN